MNLFAFHQTAGPQGDWGAVAELVHRVIAPQV